MRKAIYQIGVDVLGFLIYVEHYIYQDNPKTTKREPQKRWLSVIEKTVKQH